MSFVKPDFNKKSPRFYVCNSCGKLFLYSCGKLILSKRKNTVLSKLFKKVKCSHCGSIDVKETHIQSE